MENNFTIGKTYEARSLCNYDTVFTAKVIKKTAKTVTIINDVKGEKRCKVYENKDGQFFFPLGRYSMAPRMHA